MSELERFCIFLYNKGLAPAAEMTKNGAWIAGSMVH